MNRNIRELRRAFDTLREEAIAGGPTVAVLDRMAAAVERLEGAKRQKARIHAALPRASAPGPSIEQRREEHRESTADLRAAVWERAGGTLEWEGDEHEGEWVLTGTARCEVSGVELGEAWEMHHVQGKGERRTGQRLGNLLAVSWEVHRLIHRGDRDTLVAVAKCPTLDAEARRAAEHRILKLDEARR